MAQVDTISAGILPQILQTSDNMMQFIAKFGLKIIDLKTHKISFQSVEPKEKVKIDDSHSTSTSDIYKSKIVTGELDTLSFSSEDTNYTETDSPAVSEQGFSTYFVSL